MALPVVLINSATGSDSVASGAGPGTALTGSLAAVAATATSVAITDIVNLSGVATDGSAVLWYNDTTAGHRNFDNITAISGSSGAWTVTVTNGFTTTTGPFTWAIGGKRASISSSSSYRLFNNNNTAGDAMPGWIVEMESGHTETTTLSPFDFRRGGTASAGPIILRGTSGAATMPIITQNANGNFLRPLVDGLILRDFELQNSNATKTASIGIVPTSGPNQNLYSGIVIKDGTNKFWQGIDASSAGFGLRLEKLIVKKCADDGVRVGGGGSRGMDLLDSSIISNGGKGVRYAGASGSCVVNRCIIANNTGSNVYNDASTNSSEVQSLKLFNCTIDGSAADGITVTSANLSPFNNMIVENCQITNNGVNGINFSGPPSVATLNQSGLVIRGNNYYNNTSGNYSSTNISNLATNETTNNPSYTNTSTLNYTITAGKGDGYPATIPGSITPSYLDQGAAQHQDAGGGGATVGYTSA